MFVSAAALLGLVGAAAAAPLDTNPNYPPAQLSTGFRLVVNVTDKALDFSPSIQGLYLSSIHIGAGASQASVAAKGDSSIFYRNGSLTDYYAPTTLITDRATPLTPWGFSLVKDANSETLSSAFINPGPGSTGVTISRFPEGYRYLTPETYVVCNEPVPYYQGQKFNIVKQAATTISSTGQIELNIPAGCATIRLLPECATLEDVPAGSFSSHEFALASECYANVASLNWSQYGP